jgi:hypothetical protein
VASQSGQNYIVSYKPQTVIGTPATGGSGFVLRTLASQGFALNRARIVSEENRPDGLSGAPRKGVRSAPATYACEMSYGTFDPLFESFLRGTFTLDVLNPGTATKTFFTFDQYLQDVDLSIQVETVRPLSMAVTIPAEAMSRIEWGLLGRNAAPLATGASPGLTTPTLTTTEPMAGIDATITGPGSVQFSSVSFNCTRAGGVQALIGTDVSPDVYDGRLVGEGTLNGTIESLAWLTEVTGNTPTTLTILQPDEAGNTIQFDLANVQMENFSAPVGAAAAMIVSSNFSWGGTDSIIITRNPI